MPTGSSDKITALTAAKMDKTRMAIAISEYHAARDITVLQQRRVFVKLHRRAGDIRINGPQIRR